MTVKSVSKVWHFGVGLKKSPKLQISKEHYAEINKKNQIGNELRMQSYLKEGGDVAESVRRIYENGECTIYTDEWCQLHRENCLRNYDLNMAYMSQLSVADFNATLNAFLKKHKGIVQILDLKQCDNMVGVYIMVLDQYKQVYIGQSINIKRRIMSHWSKTKQFDRLLFGSVEKSVLSIDSFGALDTTRIYVYPTQKVFDIEKQFVDDMDDKYMLNRSAGGIGEDGEMYRVEIVANAKFRDMI